MASRENKRGLRGSLGSEGWSGQTHAGAAAGFENGENIGDAEELADAWTQVQQLQFTFCALRGNVQGNERAEAGTIHIDERGEVEDHRPFVGQQSFHFRLQMGRSFGSEAAGATHYGRVFPGIGVEIQRAGRNGSVTGHWRCLFTLVR